MTLPSPPLRLVSYNILEGLRPIGRGADRRLLDRDRADAAIAAVGQMDPDVLVLNEALFCQQFRGRRVDYATLFGFPFETVALYDDAWGNAILSRWPIRDSHEMRITDRGGLVAQIDAPQGSFTVASYHPHPARTPTDKASDFTRLVADLAGPVLLCGDLNCIHPDDPIDRERLIGAFGAFSDNPEATLDLFLESGRLVFEALRTLGFYDAVPASGRLYSIPTDLLNPDKASAVRIDHVLCNDQIQVTGGCVFHSPHTHAASDHHPVQLDFLPIDSEAP